MSFSSPSPVRNKWFLFFFFPPIPFPGSTQCIMCPWVHERVHGICTFLVWRSSPMWLPPLPNLSVFLPFLPPLPPPKWLSAEPTHNYTVILFFLSFFSSFPQGNKQPALLPPRTRALLSLSFFSLLDSSNCPFFEWFMVVFLFSPPFPFRYLPPPSSWDFSDISFWNVWIVFFSSPIHRFFLHILILFSLLALQTSFDLPFNILFFCTGYLAFSIFSPLPFLDRTSLWVIYFWRSLFFHPGVFFVPFFPRVNTSYQKYFFPLNIPASFQWKTFRVRESAIVRSTPYPLPWI